MTKKLKKSNKGCRGRRLEIEVEKSDSLLQDDKMLIQKGKITDAGPDAVCEVGDIIIFNSWGLDKISLNDKDYFYILDTDEFVCKTLSE
jgi:hypothetical protein